jgi:hypothetical protein
MFSNSAGANCGADPIKTWIGETESSPHGIFTATWPFNIVSGVLS